MMYRRTLYCTFFFFVVAVLDQIIAIASVAFEQVKNGRKFIFFASSFVKHSPYKGSWHHIHPSFLLQSSLEEAEYRQSDTGGDTSCCSASVRKMFVACSPVVLIARRRRLVRLVEKLPDEVEDAWRGVKMVKTMTTAA